MAGTFTVTGLSASEPAGQRVFGPYTIQGSLVIAETLAVPLSAGDNTFGIPTSSTAVWIVPASSGSAAVTTLRTDLNLGDFGLPWNSQLPFGPYPLPTTATQLIINADSDQSAPLTLAFI